MVINMKNRLTAEYEQAYISNFTKVFTVLNEECEMHVLPGEEENYEINIKKINDVEINDYLSICFQKQNGALTIIADKKIDEEITKKIVKDVSLALNEDPLASYNFKDLKDFIIYHFVYVKENVIIDNRKILEDLKTYNQIENLDYEIIINPPTY